MKILTTTFNIATRGYSEILNITPKVQQVIANEGFTEGSALISAIGSTTGITTIEYEPGLVNQDVSAMLDKLAPYGVSYEHNKTWGDDNGAAHLRSALIGTSQTIPFTNSKLILGTWQQIVFIDFDTRSRNRDIVVQLTDQ